jgi:hemolysin activation/secretion protein
VDAAQVWIKDPLPSQVSKYELLSAGVGLRYRAERTLAALLDVGVPLRATAVTRRGDPFLHFRVAYDF